jgi:hypothetical protein
MKDHEVVEIAGEETEPIIFAECFHVVRQVILRLFGKV